MDLGTVTSFRSARTRADLDLALGEAPLAGGTWLMSTPHPQVSGLVDLTTLGWPDLEPLPDGGLRIGATCPIATLATSGRSALFARGAAALLMSFKVQQVATVGGNVCLGLPAAAMTSVLAGLAATAVVWTPDGAERRVPVAELVVGDHRTDLAPGEVLRALEVSPAMLAAPSTLRRIALTEHGRSAAVVVGVATPAGPRVVVTASTPHPVVLHGERDPRDPRALDDVAWFDDPHGAPDWRAAMTARLVAEVVADLDRSAA
ncbi:FAD binding domain-containing protein [Nocardioides sp. TRM66260-LWL]|uniref:FAD binding domain-containing protein n=1 Tax=Nocardioides sp. TRM66260-LWL TaxID=2874478 RepID=UPI001CC5A4C0|nr:FAD binding domain-containing protein [Nocardioides sp. TRM66260-LWL]MBZ5734661.1 FAD binding domain-containing protein [Nocardioides sp. TRM66260-LWL]